MQAPLMTSGTRRSCVRLPTMWRTVDTKQFSAQNIPRNVGRFEHHVKRYQRGQDRRSRSSPLSFLLSIIAISFCPLFRSAATACNAPSGANVCAIVQTTTRDGWIPLKKQALGLFVVSSHVTHHATPPLRYTAKVPCLLLRET